MQAVLSLGCGVNSVAILALRALGKLPVKFDFALFADTGTEKRRTYEYLEEVIKPFCYMEGIELKILKSTIAPSLYSYYWNKHIIPTRIHRDCTDKFKVRPMRKFVDRYFPDETIFIMGIDAGEAHRAKTGDYYPLIDMGIDREGCKRVIRKANLPIPPKSGCTCCPFTPKEGWKELQKFEPENFDKSIALEKNGLSYPEMTLYSKPLEILGHREQGNDVLCSWMDRCAFCE